MLPDHELADNAHSKPGGSMSSVEPEVNEAVAEEAVAVARDTSGVVSDAGADWTRASVYALGFLTLISTLNYFDRSVISLVMPLIQKEMGISNTTVGVISSVVAVYAIVGVPVAALADRWSRKNVIAAGFFFWSAMTALTGLAGSVWQLISTRFLMAVGESCGVAPSNSLMSDVFSKRALTTAIAIFTCASSIAAIVYSPGAGWLADHFGWRSAFLAAGVPGMVLAFVFFATVKEPARGGGEAKAKEERAGFIETFRFLAGSPAFWSMIVGGAFLGAYLYGTGAFGAIFLVNVHDLTITYIGAVIGPIRGVVSAVGILLGGVIAGRLSRADERWRSWTPALACLLLAPAEAVFVFADPTWAWMTGLIFSALFSIMYQPAVYAALMAVARPRMRATAVSINLLAATVVGQFVGPILIGELTDLLTPAYGNLAVRYSMGVVILCAVIGGLCFAAGGLFIARDIRRAAE
jgi:MFS family permease